MNDGTPEEVLDYYSDLFQQVSETDEWKAFLEENVMGNVFYDNEEYVDFNADLTQKYIKFMEMIERNQ
jgi:tripartite-type tricarboxylate transporter receptor subunit TctC